jgi:hypothetical protein
MPLILDLFSQFPRSPIRPDWLGLRTPRDRGHQFQTMVGTDSR